MTTAEFIKKYSQNYQLLKDKFVNKDKELESDLDEVIKDEVKKSSHLERHQELHNYLDTERYIEKLEELKGIYETEIMYLNPRMHC